MYTIDDLNLKLLSELKEIAEGMNIKNAKKLAKEELVYKILDQQAAQPEPKTEKAEVTPERKMRPRRRENVTPPVAAAVSSAAKELTSDELLKSVDLEIDQNVTRFEDTNEQPTEQPEIVNQQEKPLEEIQPNNNN